MEHKDCIIVYKHGKGVVLRATRLTVENQEGLIVVYDGDDLMAIVPLAEIKTVVFANCGDAESIERLIKTISEEKTIA